MGRSGRRIACTREVITDLVAIDQHDHARGWLAALGIRRVLEGDLVLLPRHGVERLGQAAGRGLAVEIDRLRPVRGIPVRAVEELDLAWAGGPGRQDFASGLDRDEAADLGIDERSLEAAVD